METPTKIIISLAPEENTKRASHARNKQGACVGVVERIICFRDVTVNRRIESLWDSSDKCEELTKEKTVQ